METTFLESIPDDALTPLDTDSKPTLVAKERTLHALERDVKKVADEISARQHLSRISYCIDFDVIYSAANWLDKNSENQFWSSILFFIEGINLVALPGTLAEALRFIERRDNRPNAHRVGPLGDALLSAISHIDGANIMGGTTAVALNNIKQSSEQGRKLHILLELVKKLDPPHELNKLKALDRKLFFDCNDYLAESLRANKIFNNKIDAINYTLAAQLNREARYPNPAFVLVSDSSSLSGLHRAFSTRLSRSERAEAAVWNSRVAAIFATLIASSRSVIEARNTAWELYQILINRRRAIQWQIDNYGSTIAQHSDSDKDVQEQSYRPIFDAISRFAEVQHVLDQASDSYEQLGRLIDRRTKDINYASAYREIRSYVKKAIAPIMDAEYNEAMLGNKKEKFNVIAREKVGRFTYDCRFDIKDEKSNFDTLLRYGDEIQIIVKNRLPISEYIDILNRVRNRVKAGIGKASYENYDDDGEVGVLLVSSSVADYESGLRDFRWAEFRFEDSHAVDHQSSREGEVINFFEMCSMNASEVEFARYGNKHFDMSLEAGLVTFTARRDYIDEIRYFCQRASQFDFDKVLADTRIKSGLELH